MKGDIEVSLALLSDEKARKWCFFRMMATSIDRTSNRVAQKCLFSDTLVHLFCIHPGGKKAYKGFFRRNPDYRRSTIFFSLMQLPNVVWWFYSLLLWGILNQISCVGKRREGKIKGDETKWDGIGIPGWKDMMWTCTLVCRDNFFKPWYARFCLIVCQYWLSLFSIDQAL